MIWTSVLKAYNKEIKFGFLLVDLWWLDFQDIPGLLFYLQKVVLLKMALYSIYELHCNVQLFFV